MVVVDVDETSSEDNDTFFGAGSGLRLLADVGVVGLSVGRLSVGGLVDAVGGLVDAVVGLVDGASVVVVLDEGSVHSSTGS